MDHASFMSKLLRPTYVWRMAGGLVGFQGQLGREDQRPLVRSARTRMANAQREVDDLVLARAKTIQRERQDARQCAAKSWGDDRVRCELVPGHGPYRRSNGADDGFKPWDHAAPSEGTFWMDR